MWTFITHDRKSKYLQTPLRLYICFLGAESCAQLDIHMCMEVTNAFLAPLFKSLTQTYNTYCKIKCCIMKWQQKSWFNSYNNYRETMPHRQATTNSTTYLVIRSQDIEKTSKLGDTLLCKTNMRKEAATVSEKTLVGQLIYLKILFQISRNL